jgi:hypothetical protein
MIREKRVAAFDDDADLSPIGLNDTVFLFRRKVGIVVAGRITSNLKTDTAYFEQHGTRAIYFDVEWLTELPRQQDHPIPSIPTNRIKDLIQQNLFHPRTVKRPYLSQKQTQSLLTQLLAA